MISKLRKISFGVTVVLLAGFMMSCNMVSEKALGIEDQGKGTVVFKITDAPFPVDLVQEANVTIDWIKLLKHADDDLEDETQIEGEIILVKLEEPATFNLLELRNGLYAILAEAEVPAGAYAEIRMHLVEAGILLKDETSFNLKIPGGESSGLKIKLNPSLEVESGVETEVLVDFDLSRSFVMQGKPGHINGFIFKPVVRAVANVKTNTGEISGVVADQDGNPVGNASLTLLQGEEVVTTALTSEEEGYYSIIGIHPGDYSLVLEVGEYSSQVEIAVEAGSVTVQNFETGVATEEVIEGGQEGTDDTSGTD